MSTTLVVSVMHARRTRDVGRTPTCWRRACAQETRRITAVPKLCAWLRESPRPRLRQGPLFGDCLRAMFDGDAPAPRHEDPNAPEERADWRVEPPGAAARSRATHSHDEGRPHASPDLAPATARPSKVPRRLAARGGARAAAQAFGPITRPPSASELRLRVVDGTAAKVIDSTPPCADRPLLSRLVGDADPPRTVRGRDALPAFGGRTAVRNPLPPDGGATGARRRPLPASRRRDGRRWMSSLDHRLRRRLSSLALDLDGGDGDDGDRHSPFGSSVPAGPQAPRELLRRFEARPARYPTHAQSNAPITTSSDPYLEPPAAPYEPPVPVASARLRRGARQERHDTEPTDSTDLTEKISRILDDEARRHGIDV